jgi:Acetoacetate decarboxylase (ADC)
VNEVAGHGSEQYGSGKFQLNVLPHLDAVMLMFVDYTRIISGNDDDRRLGGTRYREFLAMQLALSPDDNFPELDWFIPFIYLDTDAPRLAGREIFGYPKQFATVDRFSLYKSAGSDLELAKELQLTATVVRRVREQHARRRPVIRVDGPAGGPPRITSHYLTAEDMFRDQLQHLGNAQDLLREFRAGGIERRLLGADNSVENALAFSNIGNVFLKQFRDCANPKAACYQAVCKTDTVPGRFHGGASLDPSGYRITIHRLDSDPLFSYIFGDSRASTGTITPVFAYCANLDIELTNGRVIANPYEKPYVPDISTRATRPQMEDPARLIRRSRQAELLSVTEDG